MIKVFLPLILLFPLLPSSLQGQDYIEGPWNLGISFLAAFPTGEFHEQMDRTGWGLTVEGAYVFKPWPVMAGVTGSFAIYNTWTSELKWYDEYPSGLDVSYTNSLLFGHLFLRFQPQNGYFRPYFEGLFGSTVLSADASIDGDEFADDETAKTSYSTAVLSYGAGGGIAILLHEDAISETRAMHIFLDLRIRYLTGGEVEYYQRDRAVLDEDGTLVYEAGDKVRSRTDVITASAGIIVRL